jgi:REP element-mobilizing transposase RayT
MSAPRGAPNADVDAGDVPLAYLITFTTYGTWLHGDSRGSVDRDHNIVGTPYLDTNRRRLLWEHRHTRQAAVTLDAVARRLVKAAITEVCAHRNWSVHALNVRTNHVHAVVAAPVRPERIVHDLKSYATRALRRARRAAQGISTWTAGGSTRYLWNPAALRSASEYVAFGQGEDL